MSMREVHDPMGTLMVPRDAYYGAQTARAVVNFPISGLRPHPDLVRALAAIKWAAARVNGSLGLLRADRASAIEKAAREVLDGGLREQFVVDAFNAGAGTSLHMNANEVIAARAREFLGGDRGDDGLIHQNDHVNLGQSTNDVMPAAIRLAGLSGITRLSEAGRLLAGELRKKAAEFDPVIKSGRTHLQDAVPIRLGQEFAAYAECVERSRARWERSADGLRELGLGGSAAGTGLNTHPEYRARIVAELSDLYQEPLRPAVNLFEAMQSQAAVVDTMASLRGFALELLRITNDLRLLASGPRTGLAEIRLPAVQPGSSIMPGKVNPVIAEVTAMVCYQVVGCDAALAAASAAGQLELNVMLPVIAFNLLFALDLLTQAAANLAKRCVAGIEADPERCRRFAEDSLALATILNPVLGYEKTAALVKEAVATGKNIRSVLEESGLLSGEQISAVLDLERWTKPGLLETPPPG